MKHYLLSRTSTRFLLLIIIMACYDTLLAQAPPALPDTSKMKYNQISNGLKLYVFPAKG